MPKAKKLPSGSWRCQVYSHSIPLYNKDGSPMLDNNGKPKKKRIYESFTSEDPSKNGKKEAEFAAAQFALEKKVKSVSNGNMTIYDGITKYIAACDGILAPSTIRGYRNIQKNSFQSIMKKRFKDLTTENLKEAVNEESKRISPYTKKAISPKTVRNSYGLITAVINAYYPSLESTVRLPQPETKIKSLPDPGVIIQLFKGDRLELAVLLAMWLSFSMSEVRGLTKSKSLEGDYLVIREVVVNLGNKDDRKPQGKVPTRNRMHRIPPYIKQLIDQVDGDIIVPYSAHSIYKHFTRVIAKAGIPHMTFHDLRHLNASVMAMLQIPEKYALERGGWKTDKVMKQVYTHTFTPERQKVDIIIDQYFEKLMAPEEHKPNQESPEEIINTLKASNPDGWYDALIEFMQHEMQHKK
ncbi:MAG: tyrosine-type recombinase/integrase [Enterocloster asparagiformis]|nr:tyrosine-type recombinase/integrase [Enterocloster asparagiformis]